MLSYLTTPGQIRFRAGTPQKADKSDNKVKEIQVAEE
jgi:hypothetical protein